MVYRITEGFPMQGFYLDQRLPNGGKRDKNQFSTSAKK
jgi:hypothetical protein